MPELSFDNKIVFAQALMEYLELDQQEIDEVPFLMSERVDALIIELKRVIGPVGKSYVGTLERLVVHGG